MAARLSGAVPGGRPDLVGVRLVLSGVTANAAVGTLFAWSLVAENAARGVGMAPAGAAPVFAGAMVVFTVVLLAAGRASRRIGPRPLLVVAAGTGGVGLLLATSWHHPLALWVGVAGLFGTSNGLAYSVATSLASRVPHRRRGAATGLVVAAYAAGPVLLGVTGPPLLEQHGWRACLAGLALLVAGLLLVAAWLAPGRGPSADRDPARRPGAAAARGTVPLLWLVFAGGTAPALMVFAHAVPLATTKGLDSDGAGIAVSALAAGNLAGRVVAGWVSDRVGRPASLGSALTLAALAILGLACSEGSVTQLTCFAGLGVSYGAVSALVPAATADLVGGGDFPRAYARVFTAWGVAGLTGPMAGAWLLRIGLDVPAVLILAGAPLVAAAGALMVLSRRGYGPAAKLPAAI